MAEVLQHPLKVSHSHSVTAKEAWRAASVNEALTVCVTSSFVKKSSLTGSQHGHVSFVCESFMNISLSRTRRMVTPLSHACITGVESRCSTLNLHTHWTERGTNQFRKWSRSVCSLEDFVLSNESFANDTTLLCSAPIFFLIGFYFY